MTKRKSGKPKGLYLFALDYLNEINGLSDEAAGFWTRIFLTMTTTSPPGVAPGDSVGFAAYMGIPPAMAETYFQLNKGKFRELEEKGVFARGCDIDPHNLPANAIVNRRLYKEWMLNDSVSAKRRAAALRSWIVRRGQADSVVFLETDAGMQTPCKTMQKSTQGGANGDANAMQKETPQTQTPKELAEEAIKQSASKADAKTMQKAPLPYLTLPKLPQPNPDLAPKKSHINAVRVPSELEPISDLIPEIGDGPDGGFISDLLDRIHRVTGDSSEWMGYWLKVVDTLGRQGGAGLGCLDGLVQYAEDCADENIREAKSLGPLKNPGGYIYNNLRNWAKVEGVTLPVPPTETGRDA